MNRLPTKPDPRPLAESSDSGDLAISSGPSDHSQVAKSQVLSGYFLFSLLVCALGFFTATRLTTLDNRFDIFFHQFIIHDGPGALLTGSLLIAAVILSTVVPASIVDRFVGYLSTRIRFVAVVCFFVFAAAALTVYEDHPLAMDEYMPTFQARAFAEGEIYGRFPPELIPRLIPPQFLNRTFVAASLASGKVISTYLPGFALLLTPFMKLGAPWALNPLLSACTLFLIWRLARCLSPDPLAPGWAVLLTLASPVFSVNAISYYTSAALLFFNLLFMFLLLNRTVPRLVLAGLVGSVALTLQNPVPHALFALPWLVWLLWRRELKDLGALALGYLPLILILGLGWISVRATISAENAALLSIATASPAPASVSIVQELRAFFGVLQLPDADLLTARLLAVFKLFFWALPGLPILAILGYSRLRHKVPVRLLVWSAVVTFVFFFFVKFTQGHGWGYRYFHPAWALLPLLGAAALSPDSAHSPRWRKFIFTLAVLSLVFGTTVRFDQVHQFINRHRAQVAAAHGAALQVRFVEARSGYYVGDLIQNDPFLRGPVWTFLSLGKEADEALILKYFPGARLAVDLGPTTAWIVE